jgi:putative NADPH-quinone reductase
VTVLLVFAHPCRDSFVGAVFDRAVEAVESADSTTDVIDLYAEAYDPGRPLPAGHREALDRATSVVLVYPTWWSSQPAILGAWLARAAERDIAHLEHVVCVTTHGSGRCANFLIGRAGRLTVRRTFCSHCPKARFRWVAFYRTDTSRAADRSRFLRRVDLEFRGRRKVLRSRRRILTGA